MDYFDDLRWIQKGQRRRGGMTVDDPHRLAQLLEDAPHPQCAAQRVAIGTDVTAQDKTIAGVDALGQGIKIE